jgi:hypothetical protein
LHSTSSSRKLKSEAQAELDLTLGQHSGIAQPRARRNVLACVQVKRTPDDTHNVVDGRKIRAVQDVEPFSHELQARFLAQAEPPGQARSNVQESGPMPESRGAAGGLIRFTMGPERERAFARIEIANPQDLTLHAHRPNDAFADWNNRVANLEFNRDLSHNR